MFIKLATKAEEGNNVYLYQLMETYASSFFSDMEVRPPPITPLLKTAHFNINTTTNRR